MIQGPMTLPFGFGRDQGILYVFDTLTYGLLH